MSGLREDISVDDLERRHAEVENGGHWQPSARCAPRQRIVVIVPFQNREAHLRLFLKAIHPFLQRQLLDYTIVVVEQVNTDVVFNKAVLMNVGFKEIQSTRDFDCFIFHDVDLLPENDRNFYTCAHEPRHVGAYIDKWQYSMAYFRVFGGATAFTKQQFEKANGFSTKYYGWGGEDDDMFNRISAVGMKLVRYPKCVATYTSLDHGRDAGNPANPKGGDGLKSMPPHQYQEEGVRQVSKSYQLIGIEKRPLFTRIKIKMKHIT